MATWAALTGRRLKPSSYDEWRKAWLPRDMEMPSGMTAYVLRKIGDPDEIIAFGLFEGSREEFEALRPQGSDEEERTAGMAAFVESVFADGAYEVVEVVRG
ncbi:MAG TPA: hypothetical protein VMN35_05990 [Gaiellaceae bacterium]|nr:hypothetical protein [Gaiellaceae bacterium]